jgi:hypothetical protein
MHIALKDSVATSDLDTPIKLWHILSLHNIR